MGYAFYERPRPDGTMMNRGYGVRCKCHAKGCAAQIDRGLAYLCYSCTEYFCEAHLSYAYCEEHEESITAQCFAGEEAQTCEPCASDLQRRARQDETLCAAHTSPKLA
jgi:hypothetical protein